MAKTYQGFGKAVMAAAANNGFSDPAKEIQGAVFTLDCYKSRKNNLMSRITVEGEQYPSTYFRDLGFLRVINETTEGLVTIVGDDVIVSSEGWAANWDEENGWTFTKAEEPEAEADPEPEPEPEAKPKPKPRAKPRQ